MGTPASRTHHTFALGEDTIDQADSELPNEAEVRMLLEIIDAHEKPPQPQLLDGVAAEGELVEMKEPELYPPCHLVHIHSHQGAFRACMVDRAWKGFQIRLSASLLHDHEFRHVW